MCVWRGLLAAVAVSCTLSRINGQPTQRLDRIKDLVCVLVLSGMQKEDLDVNMLNKLQRYNVNIEDLNNAELLQHCITISSANENFTYVQPSTTETSIVGNFNIDTSSYISHNEKATELKEDGTNKNTIQYINDQSVLQSVLKFWQDMKLNKSSIAKPTRVDDDRTLIESHLIHEQKNKRNVQNSLNLNATDIFDKLFANYLSRRNNENTTHDIKTDKVDDIGNYLKNIYILPTYNQNHNYRTFDINNNPIPNQLTLTNTHLPLKIEDNEHIHKTELVEQQPQNTSKMYNMISAFNAFKTFYPFMSKPNIIREKINTEKDTNLNPSHVTEKILATTEKATETTFSKNVIKEIAQSVKDMIIKELKKEIVETTTKSISITTTKSTARPTVQGTAKTQIDEESIMKKFLDLFNEIKLLKQPTLIKSNIDKQESKESKTKMITENVRPFRWPSGIVSQTDSKDSISSYFGEISNQNSRMILQFSPQEHKFRSNGIPKTVKQVQIKPAGPITVQTNNMEIAPLVIPIGAPQNPINQNIIVTTLVPYRSDAHKSEINRLNPEPGIGDEEYIPKKIHYLPKKFNDQPQYYSDNPKSYLDRITNLDDGHLKHSINYKAKVDPIIYSNSEPNHVPYRAKPPIPRFHEKLENIYPILLENKEYPDRSDCCNPKYAYSKQMSNCCNHVSSRQQLSIDNVKQPQYDDTHFKNFLKSQKKVTDMLERILASRNRIPSVETA